MFVLAVVFSSMFTVPIVILVGATFERCVIAVRNYRSFPWARVVRRDRLRRRSGLDIGPAIARRPSS